MAVIKFETFIMFNKENVRNRLRMLPTAINYYGEKDAILQDSIDDLELEYDEVHATISAQTRAKYKRSTSMTETAIKDIVRCNEEVKELKRKLVELKKYKRLSKLRMEVLKNLDTSMTQFGHYVRQEKNSSDKMNRKL